MFDIRPLWSSLLVRIAVLSIFIIFFFLPNSIKEASGQIAVVEEFCPETACIAKQAEIKKIDDEIYKINQAIEALNMKIGSEVKLIKYRIDRSSWMQNEVNRLSLQIYNIMGPNGAFRWAQLSYGRAMTALTGTMDQQIKDQVDTLAQQFGKTFADAVQIYAKQAAEKMEGLLNTANQLIESYNDLVLQFNALTPLIEQAQNNLTQLLYQANGLEKDSEDLLERRAAIKEILSITACPIGPPPEVSPVADESTGDAPTADLSTKEKLTMSGATAEAQRMANTIPSEFPPVTVNMTTGVPLVPAAPTVPEIPPPAETKTDTPSVPDTGTPSVSDLDLGDDDDLVTVGGGAKPPAPILEGTGDRPKDAAIAPITGADAPPPPTTTPYDHMPPPDLTETGLDFDRYTSTGGTTELVSLGFQGIESHTLEREELGSTARIVFGTLIPGLSTQVGVQEKLAGAWADALNIILFTTLFNLTKTIAKGEVSPQDIVDIRKAALAGDESEVRNILERLGGTRTPEGAAEGIVEDFISEIMRVGAMTQPEEVVSLAPRMLIAIEAMNNADLTTVLMNLCITANLILRSQEAAAIETHATVGIVLAPVGLGGVRGLVGLVGVGTRVGQAAGQAIASAGSLTYTSSEIIRINGEIEREKVHLASGTGDPNRLETLEFEKELSILFAAVDVIFLGFDVKQFSLAAKAHTLARQSAEAIRAVKEAANDAIRTNKMELARQLAAQLTALLKTEARFALFEFKTFAAISTAQVAIAVAMGNPTGAILPLAMLGIRGGTAVAAARAQRSRGGTVEAGTPVTVQGQQGEFTFVRFGEKGEIILRKGGGEFTFAADAEILTTSGAKPIFKGNSVTVAGQPGEFVFVGKNEFGEIILKGEKGEITVSSDTEIALASAKKGISGGDVEPTATTKDLKEGMIIRIDGRKGEFQIITIKKGQIKVIEVSEEEVGVDVTIKIPRIFSFDPDLVKFRIVSEGTEVAPPVAAPVRPLIPTERPAIAAFEPGTVVRVAGEGDADFVVQGVFPNGKIMVRKAGAPTREDVDATAFNTKIVGSEKLTVVPKAAETGETAPVAVQPPTRTAEQKARSNLLGILQRELAMRIETDDSSGREFVRTADGEIIFLGKLLGIGTEGIVFRIDTQDGNPTNEVLKINKTNLGNPSGEANTLDGLDGKIPIARVTGIVRDAGGNVVALKKEFVSGSTLSKLFKDIQALLSSQDPAKAVEAENLRQSVSLAVGNFLRTAFDAGTTEFDFIPANLIMRSDTCELVLIDAGGIALQRSSLIDAEDFFNRIATDLIGGFGFSREQLGTVFDIDTVRTALGGGENVNCPAPAEAGFEGRDLFDLIPAFGR